MAPSDPETRRYGPDPMTGVEWPWPELRRTTFTHDELERTVAWIDRPGPTVILLHEMGGLSSSNVAIGHWLAERGFAIAMPVLLPPTTRGFTPAMVVRHTWRICVAGEFAALKAFSERPLSRWIRALASSIAAGTGRRVGVVGMCMTGSFALAAAIEPDVSAAVASQPSIPYPIGKRRRDLLMSAREFDALVDRAETGFCVRMQRFRWDPVSSGRAAFIRREVPNADVDEIPNRDPRRHSVFREGLTATPGSALADTLERTLAYLHARLDAAPDDGEG